MARIFTVTSIVLLLLGVNGQVAQAEDWATVVLEEEEPLREIEAGVEYQLRFRVLYHGGPAQPMTDVSTVFQFSHLDSSATTNIQGEATDDPTLYVVTFRLDREGIWQWNAFVLEHRTPAANHTWFPSLLVVAPGTLSTPTPFPPATPASFDGTWAVVALDRHIGVMIVGEETVVTFRVLAEGRDDAPIRGATVVFSLKNNDTGAFQTLLATELTPGHYELRVTIPDYLHWSWAAIVYGYGNMSPQITGFPWFRGVGPGSGGGRLTITDQPENTINVLPEWLVPSPLVIEAGTTVTWVNDRETPFFIFGAGGPFEQLGLVEPGESVTWTYDEPGDYAYVIGPAPFFTRGEIRVT